MKKLHLTLCLLVASLFTSTVSSTDIDQTTKKLVETNLTKLNLTAENITNSRVDGLLNVYTDRGLFYFSVDGQYLIHGKVYDLSNGVINTTEEDLKEVRLEGVEKFKDSVITFAAKKQKYQVTVFTDTSCGYCRQLHTTIDEYNKLGITVHYLAFPRSGLSGPTFKEMSNIWCAKNPKQAMTNAKNGDRTSPEQKTNCNAPITEHYNFGMKVEVTGTPAIVLSDGSMVPGYQKPSQLLNSLQQM
jgi:thiol:disulfide interchange protein DsbC